MKRRGLAAPEQHQHVHGHLHFSQAKCRRMTDDPLNRGQAACTILAAIERERESADAKRARFRARPADEPGAPTRSSASQRKEGVAPGHLDRVNRAGVGGGARSGAWFMIGAGRCWARL